MGWDDNHAWCVGKDLEENGCDLFDVTRYHNIFREELKKSMENLSK